MKPDRSLRALMALAHRAGPAGIMELSADLGEPPASVHRTLQALVEHDLATQEESTKRYRLGPAVLELADAYRSQNDVVRIGQPILDNLRDEVQETAFLCALVDNEAVVVAIAESPRPLRYFMRLGHRMPYHAAASARAILAFQPESVTAHMIQAQSTARFTDHTRTTAEELEAILNDVRRDGYAVCNQELEVGVKALSRPIWTASGHVNASVTVVAPVDRLSGVRETNVLVALRDAAESISRGLGLRAMPKLSTADFASDSA